MAVLTIGLQTVRAEFNTVFPLRDKTTDGWIGNQAHQVSTSGHNPDRTGLAEYKDGDALDEVRAIDVDKDLRDASGLGVTMEQVVQYLIKFARAGGYLPFRYLIFNGRIWRKSTGWKTETYTGSNKHTEHLHASGDYTQTADSWKGSLGLKTLVARFIPAKVTRMNIESSFPLIGEGNRDDKLAGYNLIERIQAITRADRDGIWGPGTTAAIAAWVGKKPAECKKLTEEIYRKVFGLEPAVKETTA